MSLVGFGYHEDRSTAITQSRRKILNCQNARFRDLGESLDSDAVSLNLRASSLSDSTISDNSSHSSGSWLCHCSRIPLVPCPMCISKDVPSSEIQFLVSLSGSRILEMRVKTDSLSSSSGSIWMDSSVGTYGRGCLSRSIAVENAFRS